MRTFNIIALVVVAALVVGAVGVALVDELFLRNNNDEPMTFDPAGDTDTVAQGYRDQIENDPNDVSAMSALANYLGNTGNIEEAITWYERALAVAPDDNVLRLDFASALASAAKSRDAELQYQKVIEAEPDNATALLYLARLYRGWSPPRLTDAVTYYQLAIERAGDSVIRGLAQEELGFITGTPAASPDASPSPQASGDAERLF